MIAPPNKLDICAKEHHLNCYLLSVISSEQPKVCCKGIYAVMQLTQDNLHKIIPHERVINQKQDIYEKQLIDYGRQLNPVTLLVDCPAIDSIGYEHLSQAILTYHEGSYCHQLFKITRLSDIEHLSCLFNSQDRLYIADGHHRIAAIKNIVSKLGQFSVFIRLVSLHSIKLKSFFRGIKFNCPVKKVFEHINFHYDIIEKNRIIIPENATEVGLYTKHNWYLLKERNNVLPYQLNHQIKSKLISDRPLLAYRTNVQAMSGSVAREDQTINTIQPSRVENDTYSNYSSKHDPTQVIGSIQLEKNLLTYDLNPENPTYFSDIVQLQAAVDDERIDYGFTLKHVTVSEFIAFVNSGDLMPPHTTYFYPKPLDNIVCYQNNTYN